jgi:hypothetical protein
VLKPDGMAVVMFTHRSTEAWERLIQSLLDAGLYPTASFPVHTEMEASTHQRGKGAIQSTILMACRRRPENAPVGWYGPVRAELERVIPERLAEFWRAGIRGADFFISAIGPAVGVFGRYRKVMRPDGREVAVGDLLDEARSIVTAFALEQLGLSRLDEPTRFYVLYRWAYGGEDVSFDEANKLAKSVGAELDALVTQHHLVTRRGDTVQLPTYAERLRQEVCLRSLQKALEDGAAGPVAGDRPGPPGPLPLAEGGGGGTGGPAGADRRPLRGPPPLADGAGSPGDRTGAERQCSGRRGRRPGPTPGQQAQPPAPGRGPPGHRPPAPHLLKLRRNIGQWSFFRR